MNVNYLFFVNVLPFSVVLVKIKASVLSLITSLVEPVNLDCCWLNIFCCRLFLVGGFFYYAVCTVMNTFFKIKFAGSTASRVKWGCATRQCSFNYISFLKNPIILLSFTSVLSALLYAVKNSIKTISFEMTQSVGKLLCEQWEPALCPLHPSSASSPGIFLWLPGKEQYWRELSWCCWGDGVFLLPGLSVITK